MCGIIGATAQRNVTPILLEGLKRLEYRGYDSAGIAVYNAKLQKICRLRSEGKVAQLRKNSKQAGHKSQLTGHIGIAHTRWATHGKPSAKNAHPHLSNTTIAIVHNGIIENHNVLRKTLKQANYLFDSDTDSEVIAHLLHFYYLKRNDMLNAIFDTTQQLQGAFALGIINSDYPDHLWGVRNGSPLTLGIGIEEHFITSDACALWPVTQQFIYLEDNDVVELRCQNYQIYSKQQRITRPIHKSQQTTDVTHRGAYRHYMLKEIFEQPLSIQATLGQRDTLDALVHQIFGSHPSSHQLFNKVERIQIAACGTSYHASLIARYWLESLAGIPCQVEIASEIRYRETVIQPNTLFIAISQSGETADTLAALHQAKTLSYLSTLSVCNVPNSSLVRDSDHYFMTKAGPEIGVASTKAFTTQLTALLLLTLAFQYRDPNKAAQAELHMQDVITLPQLIKNSLNCQSIISQLALQFAKMQHALFLGRGIHHPIAMEGALKLKEISYIHAEAYPAGELKHGPLALIDEHMPVILLMPHNHLASKLQSNLQEIKARGGQIILLVDTTLNIEPQEGVHPIQMPTVPALLSPIVYTIPLQLLAYHVAMIKGTDIDQPRHLAKSVTVE